MVAITAVVGWHEFLIRICLRALEGNQISTGRENIACSSAVLPMLSETLEFDLSDFNADDGTLKAHYSWEIV
jgi:hypothetical protein